MLRLSDRLAPLAVRRAASDSTLQRGVGSLAPGFPAPDEFVRPVSETSAEVGLHGVSVGAVAGMGRMPLDVLMQRRKQAGAGGTGLGSMMLGVAGPDSERGSVPSLDSGDAAAVARAPDFGSVGRGSLSSQPSSSGVER